MAKLFANSGERGIWSGSALFANYPFMGLPTTMGAQLFKINIVKARLKGHLYSYVHGKEFVDSWTLNMHIDPADRIYNFEIHKKSTVFSPVIHLHNSHSLRCQ